MSKPNLASFQNDKCSNVFKDRMITQTGLYKKTQRNLRFDLFRLEMIRELGQIYAIAGYGVRGRVSLVLKISQEFSEFLPHYYDLL